MSSIINFDICDTSGAVESVEIHELSSIYSTPFYLYSAKRIRDNAIKFRNSVLYQRKLICFAMKSNPNLTIIKIIAEIEGFGLDCSSLMEVRRAIYVGVDPSRIVIDGPAKNSELIQYAIDIGVRHINAESEQEIKLIEHFAAGSEKVLVSVCLRINTDTDVKSHKYLCTGSSKHKFGMSHKQAMHVLRQWDDKYPHLKFSGIMVHFGSQISDVAAHNAGLLILSDIVKDLHQIKPVESIDLGGGIGIDYDGDGQPLIDTQMYGKNVTRFMEKSGTNAELVLEPGRVIIGNAACLIAKVLYVKPLANKDAGRCVLIDASMAQLLRPALYNQQHTIAAVYVHALQEASAVPNCTTHCPLEKFMVAGPICESADVFGTDVLLPQCIQRGDLVAIMDVGAYGSSMASRYNGQPLVHEIMVRGTEHNVIARRETFHQVIQNQVPLSDI